MNKKSPDKNLDDEFPASERTRRALHTGDPKEFSGHPDRICDPKEFSGHPERRALRRGDPEEFSRLVGLYAPRMVGLALGIVHRRDLAEDVVQDALVKAYEKLGSWRGDSSLSTWLYRIVYTTALSSLRGRRDLLSDNDYPAASVTDDNDDGGDWSMTEDNISRMRRALDELSPLDRTLVNLFYMEERSVREVAAICGESESNVKTRLHRARTRLKQIMLRDK